MFLRTNQFGDNPIITFYLNDNTFSGLIARTMLFLSINKVSNLPKVLLALTILGFLTTEFSDISDDLRLQASPHSLL